MRAAVIGSGAWGTALALVLLENGHEVTLWSHTRCDSAGKTLCFRGCACRKNWS